VREWGWKNDLISPPLKKIENNFHVNVVVQMLCSKHYSCSCMLAILQRKYYNENVMLLKNYLQNLFMCHDFM
jgi:hypothetical protein